jgi:hypothetical protein
LIKVFLFNFCFAHILAIFLATMTNLSDPTKGEINWMIKKGIQDSPWF